MSLAMRPLALLAVLTACSPASAPATPTPTRSNPAMPEFALLFRATRALTPDELQRRNTAAREWAIALQREGTLRHASPLEDDGVLVVSTGATPITREGAIASVLIVQQPDLRAASELAAGHPGLAFGTQIEVRPVHSVPPSRR